MTLYIDGDAFPNLLKPVVFRAIQRLKLHTVFISNKKVSIGSSSLIRYILVNTGAEETDQHIAGLVESGDLVITADIPLADHVISKGAFAINHRGELYTEENIKHYLAVRDLMKGVREAGEFIRGPRPFNKKDAHSFANQLDRFFARLN